MPFADYAIGLAFFTATVGAAGVAAWLLLRRTLPFLTGAPRLVAFGVLATAVVILVHLVPGVLGLLSRWSALVCALLIAVGAWRLPAASDARPDEETIDRALPSSSRLSWALAATAVGALLVSVVAQTWLSLSDPSIGIDTTTFHLPGVATWIQSGTFWQVDNFTPLQTSGYYPQNGNVVTLAAVLPWENDAFARLVNTPFVALSGVGAYSAAVEIGAARSTATLLATAFASLPVISLAAYGGTQTDPVLAATFAAGALFLLRHWRNGRRSELALGGLALGIAFGTKWYGVSSVVVVLIVWAAAAFLGGRRLAALLGGGGLAGMVALGGGFWLVRNWAESGNPLMPVEVAPLGLTLFDAPRDFIRECAGFSLAHYLGDAGAWTNYVLPAYGENYGLPGAVIAAGSALAAVLALRGAGVSDRRDEGHRRVLALLACALLLIAVYLVTPYTAFGPEGKPFLAGVSTRYLLPALFLGAVVAAWAFARVGRWRLLLEALVVVSVVDGIRRGFELSWFLLLAAVVGLGVLAALTAATVALSRRLSGGARTAVRAGAVALAVFAATALGYNRQLEFNDDRYVGLEPALDWILTHAPHGQRVGLTGSWDVVGTSPVLPSFGPRLGNEVAYMGHYVDGQLREYGRRERWAAAARRNFDLIIVGSGGYGGECRLPGSQTDDDAWARAEGFKRLAASERLRLYRVTPPRRSGGNAPG